MTMTAVSDGSPPSCSEIPIATGAVTDFGATEIIETVLAPKIHAIETALTAEVIEPHKRLIKIAAADFRTRSKTAAETVRSTGS